LISPTVMIDLDYSSSTLKVIDWK